MRLEGNKRLELISAKLPRAPNLTRLPDRHHQFKEHCSISKIEDPLVSSMTQLGEAADQIGREKKKGAQPARKNKKAGENGPG